MAARIGVASLKSDRAKTIKAYEYNPDIHRGDVLCPVYRCGCELQGVQASNRTINGELISIDPFFRLPSNAEKLGRGHAPVCRFNVKKTITSLVAKSRRIDSVDINAEPLLAATQGGKAEFRLHILMEALRWLKSGGSEQTMEATLGTVAPIGTKYIRSARVLTPYLRMANAVLSLIARVQERPELAACIRLKYGSRTIAWSDYFFDLTDYGELHDQLAGTPSPQFKPTSRPVALAVKVIPGIPWHTKNNRWRVQGRAMLGETAPHGRIAMRPVLYFQDEATATRVARQEHILVCGIPSLSQLKQSANDRFKPEVEMRFNIIAKAQVCRYFPMLMR